VINHLSRHVGIITLLTLLYLLSHLCSQALLCS
jgi:hypothetical protein